MACSKIFSEGGLSELLSDIMQYFRNDFSTLHSYTLIISDCIEKWVAAAVNTHNSDFVKFIHKSLIKIFIENKAKLYIFNGIYHNKYFDESILQSSHFIYNIKILYLKINIPLLKFLSSNCESITSLYILSFVKHNTTIEYHLSQLIKSQQNLKKICFIQEFPPILLNSNNRLNTLNTIIFQNFGLSFELTYCEDSQHLELIKLITNYCTKIKFLELTGFNDNNQIIYSTFNLIETIKQNLNYLTIDINYDYTFGLNNRYTELSSIVLQNLEDYIMDMKRVKYFAFLNQFTDEEEKEELFYMIDKVEEFKLNNIVVQNYNDLKIEFFDLLKE
ncbi:hypothetical protein GLOIN_2v1772582 [Rhizophagus irregularis DAOM 181602=DAOM 197198]|nr:hypothetical protein GLOIN_2v1772582 [Rhizophagus irregularis DAOM 181602=DAOM 197198]